MTKEKLDVLKEFAEMARANGVEVVENFEGNPKLFTPSAFNSMNIHGWDEEDERGPDFYENCPATIEEIDELFSKLSDAVMRFCFHRDTNLPEVVNQLRIRFEYETESERPEIEDDTPFYSAK